MILLALFTFLPIPSTAESFRDHLSDALRLKCDALPYRTAYVDNRCYFAVSKEIDYKQASTECSSILSGAKVTTDARAHVFETMMLDKSKFHFGRASSGNKQLICSHGHEYKCDAAETKLSNGRCLVRAPKKMNFVDANKYCAALGMELPSPTNDLDNRIVRNALGKNPAWVDKSFVRDNGFKWRQGNAYSKWSTCNYTAGHNPRLYSGSQNKLWHCQKDVGTVVDGYGYWSNGFVEYQMEVVCTKNAENSFTIGASPCNYHESVVEEFTPLTGAACGGVYSPTCYTPMQTTTRYEVLGKATVETQRGCEVLCNSKAKCIAFAFKDDGFSSSCILLSSTSSKICSVPTTIFMKKTTGCVARTNLTAEFGVDPCVDQNYPSSFRSLGRIWSPTQRPWPICDISTDKWIFVRAIDTCGRRITLDNDWWNWMEKAGDMWRYQYRQECQPHSASGAPYATSVDIVAANCVIAGGEKCPCEPLKHLTAPDGTSTYPATTDRVNPCKSASSWLWWNVAKRQDYVAYLLQKETANALITCKAGMWMTSFEGYQNTWGLTAASCYN